MAHRAALEGPQSEITATPSRKREDAVYLFSEWRVLEVWTGFHIETMARVHPAALSLLLSLPILRLSICL